MKSNQKRFLALAVVLLVLAGTLSGCYAKHVAKDKYTTTVVAEYNGQQIMLSEANFMAVLSQYSYEQMYATYFGMTDFWDMELSEGKTMEDSVKADTMSALLQTKLLCSKAEEYGVTLSDEDKELVEKQVTSFLDEAGETLIERSGATEELLRQIYTDNALANRVWEYMVQDIDTTAEPEDFRHAKISYIVLKEAAAEDSEEKEAEAEATAEEQVDYEALANEICQKVKDGTSMADVTEEYKEAGYSVSTASVSVGEGDYEKTFGEVCFAMKTGDYGVEYYESEGWYILYCENELDEDATQAAIEEELDTRRDKMFEEKYAELVASVDEYVVEDEIWAGITFDEAVYTATGTATK